MRETTSTRVAICPCPPILLPGATGTAVIEVVERLRDRVRSVVGWLKEPGDPVLVLASGPPLTVPDGTMLSARAFGLPGEAVLGAGESSGRRIAPHHPGVLVAAHFLDGHPAHAIQVGDPGEVRLAAPPRAILVMGGGSARRRDGAPGYIDERAVPYDDELARLIGAADVAALGSADLALAADLLADVSAPLAVPARLLAGSTLRGQLDSYEAPFGVANYVARWWVDG